MTILTGTAPGKTITILGGIHGNEKAGIEIVKALLNNPPKDFPGTLILGFGNPKAIEKDVRYIDYDLNRCFSDDGHGYEKERAEELKTILCKTDVLIDLHCTIKPSVPFVCAPKLDAILEYIPVKKVIFGKGLYANGVHPVYADTYVVQKGGIGITIEAGQLYDMSQVEIFVKSLTNLICGKEKSMTKKEYLHAYENNVADEGFVFVKEWQNFESVPTGTLYAKSAKKMYVTTKDSSILFPKKTIVEGIEACILLEPMGV